MAVDARDEADGPAPPTPPPSPTRRVAYRTTAPVSCGSPGWATMTSARPLEPRRHRRQLRPLEPGTAAGARRANGRRLLDLGPRRAPWLSPARTGRPSFGVRTTTVRAPAWSEGGEAVDLALSNASLHGPCRDRTYDFGIKSRSNRSRPVSVDQGSGWKSVESDCMGDLRSRLIWVDQRDTRIWVDQRDTRMTPRPVGVASTMTIARRAGNGRASSGFPNFVAFAAINAHYVPDRPWRTLNERSSLWPGI